MNEKKSKEYPEIMLYIILGILLLMAVTLSLSLGETKISLWQAVLDLWRHIPSEDAIIFKDLRAPRTLMAVLMGATLGLSGASMQGLLRNPLAEPGILGVTGGGVFGAVMMFYTGIYAIHPLALPAGGIVGALTSVFLIYLLAGYLSNISTLILAGISINIIAFSGTSLILNLSTNPFATLELVFWQMGSVSDRTWDQIWLVLPFVVAGWMLLLWDRLALDALSLGEEIAESLGIPMPRVRFRIILGTALCVGSCVAVCGSVGFVGLIVPHLLRRFVAYQPGKLLGVSFLGGAILLLASDLLVRFIPTMNELKLGVVTSLAGAPFFIWLVLYLRKKVL